MIRQNFVAVSAPWLSDSVRAERGTWIFVDNKQTGRRELVKIDEYKAPDLEAYHSVITDEMEPTMNHVDGLMYTSKAKFREVYKQTGYTERGNERMNWKKEGEKWKESAERPLTTMLRVLDKERNSSSWREEQRQKREYHQD